MRASTFSRRSFVAHEFHEGITVITDHAPKVSEGRFQERAICIFNQVFFRHGSDTSSSLVDKIAILNTAISLIPNYAQGP
jgi:hypothetical protein